MHMKTTLTLAIIALSAKTAAAQSTERQVVASGGGSFSGSVLVDWTIGETVVATATTGSVILTQGFQQPLSASLNTKTPDAAGIKAWPNPSPGMVTLSWDQMPGDAAVQLYNATGALVYSGNWRAGEQLNLDLRTYMPGVYSLRMVSGDKVRTLQLSIY